jgi:hypothetical protein
MTATIISDNSGGLQAGTDENANRGQHKYPQDLDVRI